MLLCGMFVRYCAVTVRRVRRVHVIMLRVVSDMRFMCRADALLCVLVYALSCESVFLLHGRVADGLYWFAIPVRE